MDGIANLMDMSLSKLWELVTDREAWMVQPILKESDMTELEKELSSGYLQ